MSNISIYQFETIFFWISIFCYAASFILQITAFLKVIQPTITGTLWFPVLALSFHTATLMCRWISGAHLPVTNTYELNLTGTWIIMVLLMVMLRFRKVEKLAGVLIIPVCFLIMGHGFVLRTAVEPMEATYDSPWLIIHVVFAWLAFGSFAISAVIAMLLLLKTKKPGWPQLAQVQNADKLDIMSYRYIILGFTTHAIMLVSGTIWAKNLWGLYWSWDALETWSLMTFLFYAFYLHARKFLNWKMERFACLAAFGLIILSISYWGVELFAPSVHPGP